MSDYIPPQSAEIQTTTNVFRPDGRDRVTTSATYLGDPLTIGLSDTIYINPSVNALKAEIKFKVSDRTNATAGLSVVGDSIVPSLGISHVLLDRDGQSIKLMFSHDLNDRDPRAVQALIKSTTLSGVFEMEGFSDRLSVEFNSDGVEVFENSMSIKLTDNGFMRLNSYMRAASEESGFYWSPRFYAATGVLAGIPIAQTESFLLNIGVQGGFTYERRWDDSEKWQVGGTGGAQFKYSVNEELEIAGTLGYSYGAIADVSVKWYF